MKMFNLILLTPLLFACASAPPKAPSPAGPSKKSKVLSGGLYGALQSYFAGYEGLRERGVIEGRAPEQEIGRFLARTVFGTAQGRRVIFHNGKGGEISFKKPLSFQELVVVVGPRSSLRAQGSGEDFLLFRFSSDKVRVRFSLLNDTWSCAQACFKGIPDGRVPFSTTK